MYVYQLIIENRELGFSIYFTTENTFTIYSRPEDKDLIKTFLVKFFSIDSMVYEEDEDKIRFKGDSHMFTHLMGSYDELTDLYYIDEDSLTTAELLTDSLEMVMGTPLDLVLDTEVE